VFSRSAELYDVVYGFKDYAAEATAVDEAIRARSPRASTLLDVACGTGRHLAHFRRLGYRVEGLDAEPRLPEQARGRLPRVRLHVGDMREFDLGRRFDVVTCLFSAIGYVRSLRGLRRAVAAMARHLRSEGVLVIEPWLTPDAWREGRVHLLVADEPELKVARASVNERRGRTAILDFHYLVATPDGVVRFRERHITGLFTVGETRDAFARAGLEVEHDPEGISGRGLYVGVRS
jgi:SAM-dependent methyltransferase